MKGKDNRGWKFEPTRHGLASRGIETTANANDELSDKAKFHLAMENEHELIENLLKDESFSVTDYEFNADLDARDESDLEIILNELLDDVRSVLSKHDYKRDEETGEIMYPSEGFGGYRVRHIDTEDETFTTEEGFKFEYDILCADSDGFEVEANYIPYSEREDR